MGDVTKDFSTYEISGHGEKWLYIPQAHKNNLIYLTKEVLQPLRDLDNQPIFISSAYRSKKHNDAVGGAKSSQHILGKAFDIYNPKKSGIKLFEQVLANFFDKIGGIGVYANEELKGKFIHIDTRNKVNGAITCWYYDSNGVYNPPNKKMIAIFKKLGLKYVG